MALSLILGLLTSCSLKQLTSKSPERAPTERFYRLRMDKPGIIYHRKCKDKVGKRRECVETEHKLLDNWSMFAPEFILLPYKYKFP